MRLVIIAVCVVVVLLLGTVQVLSSLALRADAQPGSWVRLVPQAMATRVLRLDPRLPLPVPLRLVLAHDALADGDLALAQQHVAALAPSADKTEMIGLIAERRGDEDAAVRAFLEAGDAADLERHIARVQRSGDVAAALRLQTMTIERLRTDRTQTNALPEAYYRLGLLEQAFAYTLPIERRQRDQERSLAAYESAVALAPLAERYLVAAGNQALNLGDLRKAREFFRRAADVDPTSVDAVVGFGDLAYRSGKSEEARIYLRKAQAMNPSAPSVLRLAEELRQR